MLDVPSFCIPIIGFRIKVRIFRLPEFISVFPYQLLQAMVVLGFFVHASVSLAKNDFRISSEGPVDDNLMQNLRQNGL